MRKISERSLTKSGEIGCVRIGASTRLRSPSGHICWSLRQTLKKPFRHLKKAARKAARSPIEVLLLELWTTATDVARLQALEILRSSLDDDKS